jgi:hypothetical protein
MQSGANQSQAAKFPDNREKYRENRKFGLKMTTASLAKRSIHAGFKRNSVSKLTGNDFGVTGKLWANNRENVSVHFLHDCRCDSSADIARPDGPAQNR